MKEGESASKKRKKKQEEEKEEKKPTILVVVIEPRRNEKLVNVGHKFNGIFSMISRRPTESFNADNDVVVVIRRRSQIK
jgi:hypothetical protein